MKHYRRRREYELRVLMRAEQKRFIQELFPHMLPQELLEEMGDAFSEAEQENITEEELAESYDRALSDMVSWAQEDDEPLASLEDVLPTTPLGQPSEEAREWKRKVNEGMARAIRAQEAGLVCKNCGSCNVEEMERPSPVGHIDFIRCMDCGHDEEIQEVEDDWAGDY